MCLYPIMMPNKKYWATQKNLQRGFIPVAKDKRTTVVQIPCGVCEECMRQKARGWKIRLIEDRKEFKNGKFVTLTFSEESLEKLGKELEKKNWSGIWENEVAKIAIERFRKRICKNGMKAIRHWLITELGQNNTERVHLHGVVYTDMSKEEFQELWKYGWVDFGEWYDDTSIGYITKYVTKQDPVHKGFIPKIFTSPGIGRKYIESTAAEMKRGRRENIYYTYKNGQKTAMPTYYKNKLFSEDEREEIYIDRLNKDEKYVMGSKLTKGISNDKYLKICRYWAEKSKEHGYQEPEPWEIKKNKNNQKKYSKII